MRLRLGRSTTSIRNAPNPQCAVPAVLPAREAPFPEITWSRKNPGLTAISEEMSALSGFLLALPTPVPTLHRGPVDHPKVLVRYSEEPAPQLSAAPWLRCRS